MNKNLNVKRQNTLKVDVRQMKRNRIFYIEKVDEERKGAGLRFVFTFHDTTISLQVILQLEGELKVWKEMEVPILNNQASIKLHEFGHQQTDVTLNDFTFHLKLTTPYHLNHYYCLHHCNAAQFEQV